MRGCAPEITTPARVSCSPDSSVTPVVAPAAHVDRAHRPRPTRTSAPCASALRASAWLMAPMPPLHVAPRALHAVQLAERVVQQVVGGARRARAGPNADHAGRADGALERVGLEPVVEQVADRHRHHAEQLVHVAAREPGGAAGLAQQSRAGRRGASSRAPAAAAAAAGAGSSPSRSSSSSKPRVGRRVLARVAARSTPAVRREVVVEEDRLRRRARRSRSSGRAAPAS